MRTIAPTNKNASGHLTPDAINPRRRLWVSSLLKSLLWNGKKIVLDARGYATLMHECQLEQFQVDRCVDDAYTLGLIDLRVSCGHTVIELLTAGGPR